MWRAAARVITTAIVATGTIAADWDANVAPSKATAELRAHVLQPYPAVEWSSR